MKNQYSLMGSLVFGFLLCWSLSANAGTVQITDNFTGKVPTNDWLTPNAADGTTNTVCMTAGDGSGSIPACTTFTGGRSADAAGSGALRLTDAVNNQHGGILSNFTFPSGSGIQVTFTTYTYGGTGADGINFFLMDGSTTPTVGGTGGSLGYSCSNVNSGYNGVIGGYIGLGIDEYGNYLNPGDNTKTGPGFKAGRIGLRGAGNVNWDWLNQNYPTYYPSLVSSSADKMAAVKATCKTGLLQQGASQTSTWTWASTATSDATVLTNNCTSILTYSALSDKYSSNYPASTKSQKVTSSAMSDAVATTCSTGFIQQGTYSKSTSSWTWTSTSTTLASTDLLSNACSGKLTYTQLNAASPSGYPSSVTSTSDRQTAVNLTCTTGMLQQGTLDTASGSWSWSTVTGNPTVADYPVFTDSNGNYIGYAVLPSTTPIGSAAQTRSAATPISYKLQITQDGYLSLWYSYNGGVFQSVLTNQSISATNGALPANLRFGFTGSTGGSNNVHEITCFQAVPSDVSASSAGLNVESAQLKTGTQVYSAFYNSRNWSGGLVARNLLFDSTTQTTYAADTANWDASCVLTGGNCSATGATNMTAQGSANRAMLSWNGSKGVPFAWASTTGTDTLTSAQQDALDAVDYEGDDRVPYLRGDTSKEINSGNLSSGNTSGVFRGRTSILGDIIDSSPTWVGAPQRMYPTGAWADSLYTAQTLAENASGAQSYSAYKTANATRLNLVYVGANDGFLHAFRAGSYDANGNYVNTGATPNDGKEMLAYMPAAIVNTIHNGSSTGLDFSSTQYGHNYFVDATPGTGDVFYKKAWHTWLVSGLGAGGNAIYALDITDPSNFTEGKASSVVLGEWNDSTLTNLGQTYGIPVITRFHNGKWGAVFGNGLNSASGVAGIYVMQIDPTDGSTSFTFLSTLSGSSGTKNGIAYVTPVDLDSDHITDYVYAGDIYGQVWRFDLTSSDPADWGVPTKTTGSGSSQVTTGVPLFKTASGQPISTKVLIAAVTPSTGSGIARLMVMFGTGNKVPQNLTSEATYATTTQSIYDVWDWNTSDWNSKSTSQFLGLTGSDVPTGTTLDKGSLAQQTITDTFDSTDQSSTTPSRTVSSVVVCWKGSTTCTGGASANTQFGAYMDLPSKTVGTKTVYEQAVYSPAVLAGAFLINTVVPETNTPLTCSAESAGGWTYALSFGNGGATAGSYFGMTKNGKPVSAISIGAVGTSSIVISQGGNNLVSETGTGKPVVQKVYGVPGTGGRVNWAQLR